MAKQLIPRVQPSMIKEQPSQFCEIINRVIDKINEQ
jgi:hypothetical protein